MNKRYPTVYVTPECYNYQRAVTRDHEAWNREYVRWPFGIRETRRIARLGTSGGYTREAVREAQLVLKAWGVSVD